MSAAQKVTRTLNFGAISNYFRTVIMEDPVVLVSTTVHYLGSFRSFLGEKRVETSPKFVILITGIAWFLNFEQP